MVKWWSSAGLRWETPWLFAIPPYPVCLSSWVACSPPSKSLPLLSSPAFYVSSYSSLSAPNTFLCVSSLFYLQIPLCHHKKVRRHSISHLWIPIRFSEGWHVCMCCPVCVFVWRSEFLLMRWKTFHGVVDVDLKLSLLVFLLQNNLFDYKVNHSHPLTPRLNYPALPQW